MNAPRRVAIVGAGPAGTSLAALCARRGHHVTLFEKEPVARPVVGESLLPFGNRVLEILGVDMGGFVRKCGALFVREGQRFRYDFEDAERPIWTTAHQVARADFDARLRKIAEDAGALFRFEELKEAPTGFDWVVDATGRRRTLGRAWTQYSGHPSLRNSARAAHVHAALAPEGAEPGDITIYALADAWFWVIPLGEELTSVGLVVTPRRRGLRWEQALDECPELARLLHGAPPIGPLSGYQDFTEYADQFCGDGWALVGDAALFLDPVFSSGVLFALEGSERLSRVIDGELSPLEYERQVRAAAKRIEALIVGFYSGEFFDLGFTKEEEQAALLRAGMVSLLSGDVFGGEARMAQVISRRLSDFAALARDSRSD